MASRIRYKSSVAHDLRRLDRSAARRIVNKLEADLRADPDRGVPLRGEFKGMFKHRIGDYRVIYAKESEGVLVLRIAHRKDAYR